MEISKKWRKCTSRIYRKAAMYGIPDIPTNVLLSRWPHDGSIVLFDKEGQTLRRLEKVHGGTQVKTLCFSADGRLASGLDDGRLISLEAFDVLPLAC